MRQGRSAMTRVMALAAVFLSMAAADRLHGHETAVGQFIASASKANGKRIYFHAANLEGIPVRFRGGPPWLRMHGGSCVNCHGVDGLGGFIPMMCHVKAPAITYRSLAAEEHHEGTGEEGKSHDHARYDVTSLRQALETGMNPAGRSLDACMPRWTFRDEDFRDLSAYLVSLDPSRGDR